jgi:predicted transcriptional regulator of viral defense system
MLRTVGGLDADGVTDLPMRPEFQKLGLNLARVYKTIARLEQEGKVSKDHRGRYQVKGAVPTAYEAPPEPTFEPEAPAPPSRDPDEELVLKAIIGITDADVTQLAQSPDMKARGLNLSRLYKIVSRLDKDGKVTRDNRGRFQLPGGAAASAPETMEAPSEIPEKAQRPAFKPTEVTAGLDLRDPYEDTVFNAVIGQSDADVTQLVNSDTMKLRGLTLARIYKITARLEKDGKLVRDEKGRYQKSVSRGPSTSATAFDTPARPAASSPEDVMRPAIEFDATAVEGLVADVMEGLSATDIPTVAKNEALKARGVTLARLFSLCAKLEREGKLIRDEKGKYRKPGGGEAKAV